MSLLSQKGLVLKIVLLGAALGGIIGVPNDQSVAFGAVGAAFGMAIGMFIRGVTGTQGGGSGGDDSGGDGGGD